MAETSKPQKHASITTDEQKELDALLDEALQLTFPASDPIAIHIDTTRPLDRLPAASTSHAVHGTKNNKNDVSIGPAAAEESEPTSDTG
jgi:hypothetical protein